MIGGVLIVLVMLAIPPMVLMTGMVIAAVLGQTTTRDAESRFEGSELIELNK